MTQTSPRSSKAKKSKRKKHKSSFHQSSDTHRHGQHATRTEGVALEDIDTAQLSRLVETSIEHIDTIKTARTLKRDMLATSEASQAKIAASPDDPDATLPALKAITTAKSAKKLHADASTLVENSGIDMLDTQRLPSQSQPSSLAPSVPHLAATLPQSRPVQHAMSRGGAVLLIALLVIMVLHTLNIGPDSFIGSHGWAYMLGGPDSGNNPNLLKNISHHLQPTPGTKAQARLTPTQYIHLIVNGMSLDQKLGQMMIVQFVGPSYSLDLSTMISQYNVGAVLIFYANQNIHDKAQLRNLIRQMQMNSSVPMAVAIDQEGGYVDRLATLDGPRPSEAQIGASGDPNVARAAGLQDAENLTSYGINLNLAPVVDVTNVYNSQLATRTYGNNAALVTKMASAYLQGLQKSGKVLGTLKHFPGLGDVAVDPHIGVPRLTRSLANLNSIDWAPYRTLIQQGNIHAIMVTHELVTSLDASIPSSLSHKVVTGILRQQLGFQGVIMTDSLTMEGILAYASESQAAAMAVEAGADLLMGASTPSDVASMINGIKQAISNGDISQQQIDDSVQRILTMKYDMGLLPLPQ